MPANVPKGKFVTDVIEATIPAVLAQRFFFNPAQPAIAEGRVKIAVTKSIAKAITKKKAGGPGSVSRAAKKTPNIATIERKFKPA